MYSQKSSILDACLSSKYASAFLKTLQTLYFFLHYKALKESVFSLKYFTSFNSSNMLLNIYQKFTSWKMQRKPVNQTNHDLNHDWIIIMIIVIVKVIIIIKIIIIVIIVIIIIIIVVIIITIIISYYIVKICGVFRNRVINKCGQKHY